MDIRKLQRAIVDGLEDVKAQDIRVFNTEHLSPLFERVIVASGTSNRQTKALASSVRDSVKRRGMEVMRTEGEDNGEWIIVDCGAAVAHIMQPAIRQYYNLEEIWGDKAVKLKMGDTAARGLPKAETPAQAKAAAKTAAAKKSAAGKTAPAKARPASGSAASGSAASGSAARKAPAARKPPARKAGTGSAAPRQAAGKPARTAAGSSARTAAGSPARKGGAAPARKTSGAPAKAAPRRKAGA
jgi:ribosome-associated protein